MAFWWVLWVMASIVYMVYWDHVFCIYSVLVSFYRREFINWIWILSKPTKQNYKIDLKKKVYFILLIHRESSLCQIRFVSLFCYFVFERCFNPLYFSSMTKMLASFNLMLVNSWNLKYPTVFIYLDYERWRHNSSSSGFMSVPRLDFL